MNNKTTWTGLIIILLPIIMWAQDTHEFTDPAFNNGLTKNYYPTTWGGAFRDMLMLDDDRVLMAGRAKVDRQNTDFVGIAAHTDGRTDSTFGVDGTVLIDLETELDICEGVDRQSDGRILMAGSASFSYGAVVGIHPHGVIDSSFAEDGKLLFNYTSWSYSGFIYDIKVASDDGFYVTGYRDNGASRELMLTRFNAQGVLDESFADEGYPNDNGFALIDMGGTKDYGQHILLQEDDKILVVGQSDYYLRIVRFHPDGRVDSTYGENGIAAASLRVYQTSDHKFHGTFQDDGKLLVAGYGHYADDNTNDMAVVRLTAEGRIDSTFGDNGYAHADFTGGQDEGHIVALDEQQRIFVGGRATIENGQSRMGVAGFTSEGQLDTTFAHKGLATTYGFRIYRMVFDDNNKILAAGFSGQDVGNGGFSLTRLMPAGSATILQNDPASMVFHFSLMPNYPNPFNPSTTIRYRLKTTAPVHLAVYDARGRYIQTLVKGRQSAGRHEIDFRADHLASGVYFYRLKSGSHEQIRRMILLK
ncbi:MAG: T9SS type A sorting domain-containing protein [Caldithrix sp.]|nr:T9SS type A sorting domain-containing protein [Caldithrix sp.]